MTSANSAQFGKKEQGDSFYNTKNKLLDKAKKEGDTNPEENFKKTEHEINKLVEDSAIAKCKGELQVALDKAKEAYNKEKQLRRDREKANLADTINIGKENLNFLMKKLEN